MDASNQQGQGELSDSTETSWIVSCTREDDEEFWHCLSV
jgi:hypothetical protein